MDILITDVTEMSGTNYCVAGWDVGGHRMVRPLPGGQYWTAELLTQHGIAPGVTIQVTPQGVPTGAFPHRTENTPIDVSSIKTASGGLSDWMGQTAPPASADLNTGFGEHLQWNSVWHGTKQGVHVSPDTQCNSLVAVRINRRHISFSEPFDTLKATLFDGSDNYQLTVSSRVLKEAWRKGGRSAVLRALPTGNVFHVRAGLARPYGNPQQCYAMLNGVL
jgi:hypothetical protein